MFNASLGCNGKPAAELRKAGDGWRSYRGQWPLRASFVASDLHDAKARVELQVGIELDGKPESIRRFRSEYP